MNIVKAGTKGIQERVPLSLWRKTFVCPNCKAKVRIGLFDTTVRFDNPRQYGFYCPACLSSTNMTVVIIDSNGGLIRWGNNDRT